MTKETRDKISNLQTSNSHKTQRIAELMAEIESLRNLRKIVGIYLDALAAGETVENHLKLMKYFVAKSERPSGQAFKK
jgi:hypothetical protein